MAIIDDLLQSYKDFPLFPYKSYRGDKGNGYYLDLNGKRIGGVSIGSQEVEILSKIIQLSDAKNIYVIGVAFGFSTLCMLLANPNAEIYAIDNFMENNGDAYHYVESIAKQVLGQYLNIHLYIGTSPQDTPGCLLGLPINTKLNIAFIDGEHTDSAATADYIGLRTYIDDHSIVIWHDTDKISNAFQNMFDRKIFDRSIKLPTWGRIGVYLNSRNHPLINEYLSSIERSSNES